MVKVARYTKETVATWYEKYKDATLTARVVSKHFDIKHETLIKYLKYYGFPVRSPGFRANNARGVYGVDAVELRYLNIYNFAYKRRALRKNLPFELTENEFIKIVTSNCAYCNKDYRDEYRIVNGSKIPMMTVDRVDSKKGYVVGNCVPCCKTCNTSKMDSNVEEWYAHMEKILKFQGRL